METLFSRLEAIPANHYLRPPHTLRWNVTHRCYRRCAYCNNDWLVKERYGSFKGAARVELPTKRVKEVLTEAKAVGVQLVRIVGGEPFARNDIYEIIGHGVALGLELFPLTKHPFTREEADRLAQTGLPKIGVSLDSLDELTNQKLHGGVRVRDEMLRNIEIFLELGLDVVVGAVITALNYDEYEDLVLSLKVRGVHTIFPMQLEESLFALKQGAKPVDPSLILSGERRSAMTSQTNAINRRYGVSSEVPNVPRTLSAACPTVDSAQINPEGDVIYCSRTPDLVLGNLAQQGLMEVWQSPRRRALIEPARDSFKNTPCYTCGEFDLCNRVGRCHFVFMAKGTGHAPEQVRLCQRLKGMRAGSVSGSGKPAVVNE
jgi:radical SAM protein with 4Fe4S-binding SPASM domain